MQGHGTTNTGNLARRCLAEPKKFAKCLGLDESLVCDVSLILKLLTSKKLLNVEELEKLCSATYRKCYQLYPWATMSPTFHKLLAHSVEAVRFFWPIPIIFFSEDAGESWHRLYRIYLVRFVRQSNRIYRMRDAMNRALYETDPVVSLIGQEKRIKKKNKKKTLPRRANKYFLEKRDEDFTDDSEDSDSEEEGEKEDDAGKVQSPRDIDTDSISSNCSYSEDDEYVDDESEVFV